MSENPENYKRTVRIDRTRVTTMVPPEHPVYKGVMDARRVLGGSFPEHVNSIRIVPDVIFDKGDDSCTEGTCQPLSRGGSKIVIYAGSITFNADRRMARFGAQDTTLHEIGHSSRMSEVQMGAWLGEEWDEEWEETDADRFAAQVTIESGRRTLPKRTRQAQRQMLKRYRAER